MFQTLRDGQPDEVQVFRNLDEALAWLGFAGDAAGILQQLEPPGKNCQPDASSHLMKA